MANIDKDRRKISGIRVYGQCVIEVSNFDPFARYQCVTATGNLVLNTRGGCFYMAEKIGDATIARLYPPEQTTTFKTLTLFPANQPEIILSEIRTKFLRVRREMTREGIVFRFINFSEEQFESLENIKTVLPAFDPQMDFPKFLPVRRRPAVSS